MYKLCKYDLTNNNSFENFYFDKIYYRIYMLGFTKHIYNLNNI